MKTDKTVDLVQLEQELQAAGIKINSLGTSAGDVFTYDEQGRKMELPKAARSVLDAHTAKPSRDRRQELIDSIKAAKTLPDFKAALLGYFEGI